MDKPAGNSYPIHDLLRSRWSPRAFDSRPVEEDQLLSLFEAARWTPSAANGQPWAFVLTSSADPSCYQGMLSTLTGRNPDWARSAPVLVLVVAQPYPHSGKITRHTYYDVGQAVANLTLQATALGLQVHQMGGFNADQASLIFELPAECEPMTVLAIGYAGNPADLPEDLRQREFAPRTRKALGEFAFRDRWGAELRVES